MSTREKDEERADEWAQNVVDAWGVNVRAGNAALLTEEFKSLFNLACRYRDAKRVAENHRQFNVLTQREAAEEDRTLREFVKEFEAFHQRHCQSRQ